jgi:peptide deformylase
MPAAQSARHVKNRIVGANITESLLAPGLSQMILKVARLGHPVLRAEARPIDPATITHPEFQRLLDDMVETMHEYNGVGLAAPQVHLSIRAAVLEVENHPRYPDMPRVPLAYLINPEIEVLDSSTLDDWEGCLSIPELRGIAPRFKRLRVRALGRDGEQLDFIADDFHARVIQHETDHLNGQVYLDRMPNLRSLSHLAEWQRFAPIPGQK